MTCEEAIRLIHLDADGELSSEQQQALQAHILTCEGCRAEAQLVRTTAPVLRKLTNAHPIIERPEALTKAILRKTVRSGGFSHWGKWEVALDTMLKAFLHPGVRIAYAAAVLFFVGLFFLQQAQAFRSIEALGTRLAGAAPTGGTDIRFSIPLDEARHVVGPSVLEPFLAAAPVQVSNDEISVRKSAIEPWAPSLPSRLVAQMLASQSTPLEELPSVLLELQKSISSSLTLRIGGNTP